MGCFPALEDIPEMVVDFVRRAGELPEGTLPVYRGERTAKHHRGLVRKQAGVTYDQAKARQIVEQSIRKEAAAKNRPADLINIALEKVVEAGLELPGRSCGRGSRADRGVHLSADLRGHLVEGGNPRFLKCDQVGPCAGFFSRLNSVVPSLSRSSSNRMSPAR